MPAPVWSYRFPDSPVFLILYCMKSAAVSADAGKKQDPDQASAAVSSVAERTEAGTAAVAAGIISAASAYAQNQKQK